VVAEKMRWKFDDDDDEDEDEDEDDDDYDDDEDEDEDGGPIRSNWRVGFFLSFLGLDTWSRLAVRN
jgi:hypothetical protein